MILLLLIHQDKFQLQVINLVFTVAQYKCQQRRMEDDFTKITQKTLSSQETALLTRRHLNNQTPCISIIVRLK